MCSVEAEVDWREPWAWQRSDCSRFPLHTCQSHLHTFHNTAGSTRGFGMKNQDSVWACLCRRERPHVDTVTLTLFLLYLWKQWDSSATLNLPTIKSQKKIWRGLLNGNLCICDVNAFFPNPFFLPFPFRFYFDRSWYFSWLFNLTLLTSLWNPLFPFSAINLNLCLKRNA